MGEESNKDPFAVHQNSTFPKLINLLEKESVIEQILCNTHNSRKINIKNKDVFYELIYFSILIHDYGVERIKNHEDCSLLVSGNTNIGIRLKPELSISILRKLVSSNEEVVASDGLFNSLMAIYLASEFCFKFLYPNTYIVNLGKKTHEIDILGRLFRDETDSEGIYLLVETTLGFLKQKRENSFLKGGHNDHFKKAIFKKWAIERIFDIKTGLIYITIIDTLKEDDFTRSILSRDTDIKVVSFLSESAPHLCVSLFTENTSQSYTDFLEENLIRKVKDSLEHILSG